MEVVNFFALFGSAFNDILAMISTGGSLALLLLDKRYLERWDVNLIFLSYLVGMVCQVSMYIADAVPEKTGFFEIDPFLMNGLFFLSSVFLLLRWWRNRKQ